MRNYRFEIPMLPGMELSPNARVHWAARYRASEEYKGAVYYYAMNQLNREDAARLAVKRKIAMNRALLDLVFIFNTHRRRDRDNLIAMFKPGQDALRALGLIEDDSSEHLLLGSVVPEVDAARAPLTIIELKEIGEDDGLTGSKNHSGRDQGKGGSFLRSGGSRRQY